MHGLLQHELQNVLKGLGVGRVVKVANAIQALRHQVVHAHADDERLQCDALGLERTGHCARILVARFNAVGDEHDDISAWCLRKILSRQL